MGLAESMQKKMKKAMDQQFENTKKFQVEMAMKQRQAQLAMQIAIGKERFWYQSAFTGLCCAFLPIAFLKKKEPKILIPLVPMLFGWAFQYDMLYGNMQIRAQKEAERLIKEEPERFFLPKNSGIIDQKDYEKALKIEKIP